MRLILIIFLCFSNNLWTAKPNKAAEGSNQELIVFLQEEKDQHFEAVCLPKLVTYAAEKNMKLILKKAADGLPEGITSTPALVYQNAKGRSLYAGRYADFNTVTNFIRTSRVMPQQAADNCKTNVLSREEGRTTILAPLKVTSIEGAKNSDLSQSTLEDKILKGLDQAMRTFSLKDKSCIQKSDRQFYMDVYPYLSEDNTIYFSLALFAQFSCITPVFTTATPISGSVAELDQLVQEIGKTFEKTIDEQISTSKIGDALSFVPSSTPVKDWKALDLPLPKSESGAAQNLTQSTAGMEIPEKWTFYQAMEEDLPILQFHFMEPLERYAGEVREVSGTLDFNQSDQLQKGRFEVQTQSLTMGMADFDLKIHKKYIKAFKFPVSSFEFDQLPASTELTWGNTSNYEIPGNFKLMKYKKPVTMNAQLTPILDQEGNPLLVVNATFQLKITDDFNIAGPDGPEPAKQTMLFAANFLMKPI